jgi:hypothetical protein
MAIGVLGTFGLARPRAEASQGRVEVCHVTGNGTQMRLEIAAASVDAHLRHGDVMATPFGTRCLDFEPPDPVAACGATCEGPGGAGESDGFLGCVPNGEVCIEFTTCCNGCAPPSDALLSRCGGCIREFSGPCRTNDDCCSDLVCGTGAFGGLWRAA